MKIDPYVNVDAGTMRPYEHGEVFTDDGAETDLDMALTRGSSTWTSRINNVTTGRST